MFRGTFQKGHVSIFYSLGTNPLQLWRVSANDPKDVARVTDPDIQSVVYELIADNISKVSLTCPSGPSQSLGIKLPFVVLLVKNLDRFFAFEIEVIDERRVHRRFRASNFQSVTRVTDPICTMPLRLDPGWNQVQLNLADLTKRTYGTTYVETVSITIHANCRIRRVYFSDAASHADELPAEFKLYLPVAHT